MQTSTANLQESSQREKRGKSDYMIKGSQDHDRETHRDSRPELMGSRTLNRQLGNLHETDLGPLHESDTCVAWFVGGAPSNGTNICPWYMS